MKPKSFLFSLTFLLLMQCCVAAASPLPHDASKYLPIMSREIDRFWPHLIQREFPAGVADQESNGRINATLRTSREYGCGIGQFTKAFKADGTVRFDALEETKRLDPSLANWNWQDCANVTFQARAIVLKLAANSRVCSVLMVGDNEVLACAAAQYNGGAGSISKRIRLCRATPGCDATKWFGSLEYQVAQSTKRVPGYGESFAEINSAYPARVFARMPKYKGKI